MSIASILERHVTIFTTSFHFFVDGEGQKLCFRLCWLDFNLQVTGLLKPLCNWLYSPSQGI